MCDDFSTYFVSLLLEDTYSQRKAQLFPVGLRRYGNAIEIHTSVITAMLCAHSPFVHADPIQFNVCALHSSHRTMDPPWYGSPWQGDRRESPYTIRIALHAHAHHMA